MYKVNKEVHDWLVEVATKKPEDAYYQRLAYIKAARYIMDMDKSIYDFRNDYEQLPGVGESISSSIIDLMSTYDGNFYSTIDGKFPRRLVDDMMDEIISGLGLANYKYSICGSYRRQKSSIGDLDIITTMTSSDLDQYLEGCSSIKKVYGGDRKVRLVHESGLGIDVSLMTDEEWEVCLGSFLLHATGPYEHNIALRSKAKSMGLTLNQYGLWDQEGNRIGGETELEVYNLLNLDYVDPTIRSGRL